MTGRSTLFRNARTYALVVALATIGLVQSLLAQPVLPIYEPFNYPNAERIGTAASSGTNWSISLNSTGTGSAMMTNAVTLSYPGLPDQTGLCLWFTPIAPGSGRNRGMPFFPEFLTNSNPTLYYSFLLNVVSNPAAGLKQVLALSATTNSLANAMTVFLTSEGKLAIGKNSSTVATITNATALSAGTHLIVVRYKFVTGSANDELALWQDPGSLGVSEGSVPGASISTTSGTDAGSSTLGSIAVVIQTTPATPAGSFYVDELRIAKTWAAVTPSGCTPGTAFSVTGGGSFCAGDPGVSVGLSGSESGVDYHLRLNGTDVLVTSSNGPAIDFGLQTQPGAYTVLASNTTTLCVGLMTGSAVVTSNSAPLVTSSPTPALGTNSVGGLRVYTVGATGSGLAFQWRHEGTNLINGNGYAGVTTSNLTVNPVATNHAGSFDCIVSGACTPPSTSGVAVLYVRLPSNLTWVGDGSANLWDTTTANWTGDATIFTDGDNVTINDSGNNSPAIDLVGTIGPVAINVNNPTKDFTIGTTTTGNLGGTATITKSGAGMLTLTTSNVFAGKATVNGGTLSISAGNQLGTPPVSFTADQLTLNGGALQVTASGSINANRGTTLGASGGTFDIPSAVIFTNTPAITGAGGLAKIGTGTLYLPGANTYNGTTVISNGIVSIGNVASLGNGSVSLAGGTLNAATSLDPIPNPVALIASSTISGGNVTPRFHGAFSGSAGTLTFNATAATFTPRLYSTFTFGQNIDLANANTSVRFYNSNGVQTLNGVISGAGNLHRRSQLEGAAGDTVFNGANTYSGGTTLSDGGIGFGTDSVGPAGALTSGPIGTGPLWQIIGNVNLIPVTRVYAAGGARSVGNQIILTNLGAGEPFIIEGANALTLYGDVVLGAGANADCIIQTDNSAKTVMTGVISADSGKGLTKTGNGLLELNGINTYDGLTTVSAGTLGGTGVVAGPVSVAVGGNLAPGASIGTLTINNNLTLGGTFTAEVNSGASPNCDKVTGIGTLTYGGTLAIVNNGPALTASDTFQIFSATTYGGAFTSITPATPGASLVWNTNTLTTDGILRIAAGGGGPATNRTNIVSSVSGGNLTLSWPSDHLGWTLQTQTNSRSVGLVPATNAWFDVSGSTAVTNIVIPINPADPTVFYRLRLFMP